MTVYERLAACGSEQYRDFQSKLVPNIPKETILGVRTPDMRKIAKARDAAAMRKYVEDMNPVMRELGLKELRLPSWAEIDEVDIETTDN